MSTAMILEQLAGGMVKSISIFCWTLLFSLPLGLLIAFGRMSKVKIFGRFRIVRGITKLYIDVMRGTPLMLQLMVVFYGPFYLWGANIGGFRYVAIILAFSINYAAYFAEIFRGGLQAVPVGQFEAAQVLGLSRWQTINRIVRPQVVKIVLPSIGNELINLVKDSSLVYVIGLGDLLRAGNVATARDVSLVPLVLVGCVYLAMTAVLTALLRVVEKRSNVWK